MENQLPAAGPVVTSKFPWFKTRWPILLIILLAGVAAAVSFLAFKGNWPGSSSPPAKYRLDTLPVEYQLETARKDFGEGKLVLTNGVVEKVIKAAELYTIVLNNNERITGRIHSGTAILDAWFEVDKGKVQKSFNPLPKEKLAEVKAGQRVAVSYVQDKPDPEADPQAELLLFEFVLLN